MKQVIGYRCEFCGKTYLRPHACKDHEENRCIRNPKNIPFCYSCQHYSPAEWREKETVYFKMQLWEDWKECEKTIDINRCTHPERNCKLFNNIRISYDLYEGLRDAGYEEMPTQNERCPHYKPHEWHPHFKILNQNQNENNDLCRESH